MLQCTGKCWFREIEIAGSPVRRENFFLRPVEERSPLKSSSPSSAAPAMYESKRRVNDRDRAQSSSSTSAEGASRE